MAITFSGTGVTSAQLATDAIDGTKIADDAIDSEHIAADVALGGNPTTTTQSVSNNSTRIATTAYTDAQVATIVDSAPGTLNTLNELAAALGDDANFSTTTATNIAAKLPLAGGTMTGVLTVNAGGNLGFQANGTTYTQIWQTLQSPNDLTLKTTADKYMAFQTNSAEKMRILSNGDVGIGTSSPDELLHIEAAGNPTVRIETTGASNYSSVHFADAGGASGRIEYQHSNDTMQFRTGATERMRLESDGDLHVDGDVIAYSSTISDERLKTGIMPITNALSKVNQLNGCTFTYTTDGKESAGLIAQDVEKVLPSAVSESELPLKQDDGKEYKVLQYDQTIGLLVEAIKELTAKVEELENK